MLFFQGIDQAGQIAHIVLECWRFKFHISLKHGRVYLPTLNELEDVLG